MKYSRLFPLASLLGLALVSTGCVAAVPALMAASYASLGVTGVTMIRGTQIAQQNADTYRAQVQAQQASDAPQCREPDARAAARCTSTGWASTAPAAPTAPGST